MMEGITIIVLEEILMANGLTVLMMWFLLFCRRKNRESLHVGDKIYDGIAIVNLVGALSETIAFLVDGKQFTGSRQINYISNSICFIGTVSMGMPLRYNNDKQKKPLFSRGLSVCRLLFNSFSKLKIDENYKEKRRLFY